MQRPRMPLDDGDNHVQLPDISDGDLVETPQSTTFLVGLSFGILKPPFLNGGGFFL